MSSHRLYWWLLLGLAATGAAAWWSGEYFRRELPEPAVTQHAPAASKEAGSAGSPVTGAGPAGEIAAPPPDDGDRPTIYKREMY